MTPSYLYFAIVAVLGAVYCSDDTSDGRLLASKTIINQYLVEEKDLTIQYNIYNVGGRYG